MTDNPETTSDESFEPVDAPEVATAFTPEAETELKQLQAAHVRVSNIELRGKKARAALTRRQYRFSATYGAVSINAYAKDKGFSYEPASLKWHVTAQLVQNINVGTETDKDKKEALQNAVRPLAYALAVMHDNAAEHENLDDEQFYLWFADQGHTSGLRDRYFEEKREVSTSSSPAASNGSANEQAPETTEQTVETMLANPAGQLVDALPGLVAAGPGLLLYGHDGDKMRLVPLSVTLEQLAQLSGSVPHPLDNAPRDLLFHRQMLMAGVAFVPDLMSALTREKVPEGDEPNDTYTWLPANGMYLVERGRISIANGRLDDGLIVEVVPRDDIDLHYSLQGEKFIDNGSRFRTLDALTGETNAADFAASAVDGAGYAWKGGGQKTVLTFTQKQGGKSVNLIVKPREMGAIWTYRVSPTFAPIAQAVLSDVEAARLNKDFLKELHKKAPEDRTVTVEVVSGALRLANGKAGAMPFPAAATHTAKVKVMAVDLKRALDALVDLPLEGDMRWGLDPKGMMVIEATTSLASYRVHVQTLEDNRDAPVRARALRQRVESLVKAEAAAAA